MVLELDLHLLQLSDDAFESEAELIAFETKGRTLAVVTICVGVESLGSGMPRTLEHTAAEYPIPLESLA
ncbi:hypothetical protein BGZ47_002342, partial [Haplosporangium gracile]